MKRVTVFCIFVSLMLLSLAVVSVNAQGNSGNNGVATHIIVFNRTVNVPSFAQANGLQVTNRYSHALNGIAAVVPAGRLNALANHPHVAYVVENMEVQAFAQEVPTGIDRIYATGNSNIGINGVDDVRVDVDVAVLDTGVDASHPDLNVVQSMDCTGGGPNGGSCSAGGTDQEGHGTHVAGTIGALDNDFGVVGVAPGARIHSVKVLGRRGGYTSWIVAGIDWVIAQGNIEVINMSLGGSGQSTAYLDAINNAVNNGVIVVVAAGNSSSDANNYSPAFVPSAITVSALADGDGIPGGLGSITCRSDEDDTFANFSNYGEVVDIIAPGVCILSTLPGNSYGVYSGTSMAAPHVAGAVALLASGNNSPQNAADVTAIRNTLVNSGNFVWDYSDDPDGEQEPLLDVTGFNATTVDTGGGVDPTPTPSPTPCTHPNPRKCN